MSTTGLLPPPFAPPPPPLDLNGTVGALLIGGLITAVLYGFTLLQTVVYYQRSLRDGWLMKSAVFVLWVLDTFDMALIGHILYWYMVTNYGNPQSLGTPVWSILLHLLFTSLTEVVVRSMFSFRVWKLSDGNKIPAVLVGIVTLLDLVFGIIVTVKSWGKTFEGLMEIQDFVYVQFCTGLLGDTLIVGFLCYYLQKCKTGFTRTDSMIKALTTYVVDTGLLTVLAITVNIVLFAVQRKNFAFVAIYFLISKLYANAYLAMLNAREAIRERGSEIVSVHLSRGSHESHPLNTRPISTAPPAMRASHKDGRHTPLAIKVERDNISHVDDHKQKSNFSPA